MNLFASLRPPRPVPWKRWSFGLIFAALLGGLAACSSASFQGDRRLAPQELRGRDSMVQVPGGTFQMGSPHGDPDEYPPHEVDVPSFWMDRTEVRWSDYAACVRAGACSALPAERMEMPEEQSTHPVAGLNWFAARKYCAWLGKRLPSELEWEYAARAPKFGQFPWQGPFQVAFANGRGTADGYEKSAPVGSFPAGQSGFALLDMAGNVAEWTADAYRHDLYAARQRAAGGMPPEPSDGANYAMRKKVIRGGSWADSPHGLRAADRSALDPRLGKSSVGFRCAADPE